MGRPGKQTKPAAWAKHGIRQLLTDVHDYTYDVCTSLEAQGTAPDSVRIGNEINTGMLWNDGRVVNNDSYTGNPNQRFTRGSAWLQT